MGKRGKRAGLFRAEQEAERQPINQGYEILYKGKQIKKAVSISFGDASVSATDIYYLDSWLDS
jgi:hypothetical protein